jgi:sec-independent protein translocase protein TatC
MPNIFRHIRALIAQKLVSDVNNKTMSVIEHLEELRRGLIITLVTIAVCFLAIYPFAETLFQWLRTPIAAQLYMLAPAEAFMVYLEVALFGAIVVSLPMTLYQIWAFVAPGLYAHEKKYALAFIGFGSLCFALGGLFAYTVMLPFGLAFLLGYGGALIKPMITVSNYISFATTTMLVFGTVFELPLIAVFLARMGFITPALLKKHRKYAVLGAFIVGAILTPPDAFSQILLSVPLVILYEISIWLCVLLGKKVELEDQVEN